MSKATVLIVEDDGILAIHLEDLLKRQGYTTLRPISSGEEAIVAVNSLKPSIILMDIELSGKMNGITAAEVISKTSDTPVIFLTGFSQDPMLEQAKFAAPYGYLVKPVPERELAATIEMALYKHQLDHQVKQSEARYRALIEQASDGIFLADMEGNYLEVNSAFCELLGYSRKELLRLKMQDIIHAVDLATKPLKSLEFKAGPETYYERRLNRKDGSSIPVEISRKILADGSYQGIVRDITQRKEEEEKIRNSREALNKAQAVSHVGSWEWNIQDDILTWSDEMYNIFGIDKENFTGKLDEVIFLRIHPDDMEKVKQSNTSVKDEAKPIPLEYRVVLPDKSVRDVWAEAGEMVTDESGKAIRLTGIVQDITERKKHEELTKSLENKFTKIFQITPDAIAITRLEDGKYIEVNESYSKTFGYPSWELIGKTSLDVKIWQNPEDRQVFKQKLLDNDQISNMEVVFRCKSGVLLPCLMSARIIELNGEVCSISITRDMTDYKKAQESIWLQSSALNAAANAILITDVNGTIQWANKAFSTISGYSPSEVQGRNPRDLIKSGVHDNDFYKKMWASILSGDVWQGEVQNRRKDGSIYTEEMTITPVFNSEGKLAQFIAIKQDITERQKADEDLRKSEYKFSKIFQTSPDGFAITRLNDGLIIDANDGYLELFDFTPDEIKGSSTIQLNVWNNLADRTHLTHHLNEFGELKNQEYIFRKKNGQLFTGLISARTIELDGEIYNLSITRDISDRKKMEDSLRKSEEWSRFILDHANDGIHIDTPEDKIIHVNSRLCEMMGYTKEDLLKMSVSDLIAPEFRTSQNNILIENLSLHGAIPFESVNLHSSGRRIPVEVSISKFTTPDGERYINIVRDISERLNNEEQTRKQEKLIRTVFDTVPVGIFIVNEEGSISLLNPAGKEIWGDVRYVDTDGLEEYKGWWRSTGERVSAHEWGSARAFEKGERVENEEIEIESFNGEHKIISNSAYPLFDEKNKINGAVVVLQDITEKINFDEELQKRNDYLVAIQESTVELIEQLDLDRLLENICLRAGQMMNTNASFLDLINPGTGLLIPHIGLGAMTDSLKFTVQPGQGMSGIVWQTKEPILIEDYDNWDGRVEDFPKTVIQSMLGVPLISGEEVLGVLGLAHEFGSNKKFDREAIQYINQFARLATIAIKNAHLFAIAQQELADRKTAEAALKESEQRFHQMFAEHNATMLLINPGSGEIIDANPAASRFYDYPVEKLRTMRINQINQLQMEKIKEAYQSVIEQKENILIFPHRLASGEIRTVEVHSSPITVNQKIVLFSIVHDITERNLAEKQVQQQLAELRRWNTVTLGRETRVLELKHEVNDLLAKLGAPSRYQFTKEPDDE